MPPLPGRSRITYANVTATLALFIALGGTSVAAVSLGQGDVETSNLANRSVSNVKIASHAITGNKIKSNAITTSKVRDGSLRARDFRSGELPAGVSAQGPAGPAGLKGDAGPRGSAGAKGDFGPRGSAGPKGDAGPRGSAGAKGDVGPTGSAGAKGDAGAAGPKGDTGSKGDIGPSGPPGPVGSSEYVYVYNTTPQLVFGASDVAFDTTGPKTPGLSHRPDTADIVVATTGQYDVRFSVSANEPNQFGLAVNGLVVPGTTYGSGAGTQQNVGSAIVALNAGDALTLRNNGTATGPATLQHHAGGTTANVNASLRLTKLD